MNESENFKVLIESHKKLVEALQLNNKGLMEMNIIIHELVNVLQRDKDDE